MAIEKGIGAGGIQLPMDGIDPEEIEVSPLLPENPDIEQMEDGSVLVGEIDGADRSSSLFLSMQTSLIMWTNPSLCGFRLILLVTLTMTFLLAVIGRRRISAASIFLGWNMMSGQSLLLALLASYTSSF